MEEDIIIKQEAEDFQAEYEIHFVNEQDPEVDEDYAAELRELDELFAKRLEELQELDDKIDRLTCHADKWDYTIAAASGLLTGLLDSFWVGDMKHAQELSSDKIDSFVKFVAKKKTGYNGDSIATAIDKLEGNDGVKIPTDNIWKGTGTRISGDTHHLDDMAHHPTLVGLFFSILTQFTYKGYFQNKLGNWFAFDVDEKGKELIGKNLGSKISAGVINWFFHLISDMAGSSGTRVKVDGGLGTGIPGPIIAFAKEIACIPGINKRGLPMKLKDAFYNYKCDFRCELTQSIPVLFNEIIVRTFYMIRRLVVEIKKCKNGEELHLKNIIPFNNRTIARMITVASGTFVAVDMADAAIRAAGTGPAAGATFVMHLNIPGMTRCVIAVGTDLKMGLKKERTRNKRLAVYQSMIDIAEAKLYYKQGKLLIQVEKTEQSIKELCETANKAAAFYVDSLKSISNSTESISKDLGPAIENNPTIGDMINDIL